MIILVWVLNFGISWLNAWGSGKTWAETKHEGGAAHFMNWMSAIMSACGFTWCYLVIFGLGGLYIPFEQDDGTMATLFTVEQISQFSDLGYLVIILPILGSGLAITLNSWGYFWRRRTFSDGAVAGYNSFAQVYNMVGALEYVPDAVDGASALFDGDDPKASCLLAAIAVSCAGGILTTYTIIKRTARQTARDRYFKYTTKERV